MPDEPRGLRSRASARHPLAGDGSETCDGDPAATNFDPIDRGSEGLWTQSVLQGLGIAPSSDVSEARESQEHRGEALEQHRSRAGAQVIIRRKGLRFSQSGAPFEQAVEANVAKAEAGIGNARQRASRAMNGPPRPAPRREWKSIQLRLLRHDLGLVVARPCASPGERLYGRAPSC